MIAPRNAEAPASITDHEDRIAELMDEIAALGHALNELSDAREDRLDAPRRAILREAAQRIERNLGDARELINEIAEAAKGGPS